MKLNFNDNWTYGHLDETWRKQVDLPHDAMLYEQRTSDSQGGKNVSFFDGKDYVYEKSFQFTENIKNKDVFIEFEGVYKEPKVYLNNQYVGGVKYGYRGFILDLTPFTNQGENRLRVECFNSKQPNSRWYSGAGIYRPVSLYILPKNHLALDSLRVKTISIDQKTIKVIFKTNCSGNALINILDNNRTIYSKAVEVVDCSADAVISLPDCELWDIDHPKLYTCQVIFGDDEIKENFGIRMISCSSQTGFLLNDKRVILLGACIHHDNGLLGACCYPYVEERKIRLLKASGYNAIRSAHNPCSKALLNACDKLGMLVLDEYVDMWYIHKTKYDYASDMEEQWQGDLKAMVDKDYNHPSVIMYSIGNEVAETAQKRGIALTEKMHDYLHSLDDRPVTCGINIFFNLLSSLGFGVYSDKKANKNKPKVNTAKKTKKRKDKLIGSEFFNYLATHLGAETMKIGATFPGCDLKTKKAFSKLDIAGYNYGIYRYKRDIKRYPDRLILGSETFCSDARRFWLLANKEKAIIGDFVWAGIDYLGEAGIGAWEYDDYAPNFKSDPNWISASSGRLDLTGKPSAEVLYTKVAFDQEKIKMATVRPDKAYSKHSISSWRMSNAIETWSWNGLEGMKTQVEVYSTGKSVATFLNDKLIKRKKNTKNTRCYFKIPFEKGTITAISYDEKGKEIARCSLTTAGDETKLTLIPEEETYDVGSLCYVRIRFTDDKGEIKPLARSLVHVEVEGGKLLALGSASPYNDRGYLTDTTDTYYGEALAIIKPYGEKDITVKAISSYGDDTLIIPKKK